MVKSSSEFLLARKSHSAKKTESTEFYSLHNFMQAELNSLKSCASASNVSARGKQVNRQKSLEVLYSELSQDNLILLPKIDDQKLFLRSSQILEKLSKVINNLHSTNEVKENSQFSSTSAGQNQIKLSIKAIIFEHDVLKKLLIKRFTMVFNEECNICIKQAKKLLKELKLLYFNEKLKMTTLPIQSFNRFIGSSDISVFHIEILLQKLKLICDLHVSLASNYQRIIEYFQLGFNTELHLAMLVTNQVLSQIMHELFYWAYKNFTLNAKKLCLADHVSISPEFLENTLETYHTFTLLMLNRQECKHVSFHSTLFHNTATQCEVKELSCTLILKYLSSFESRVAAERIVHFLINESKKTQHVVSKNSSKTQEVQHVCGSSTSDYCSASTNCINGEDVTNSSLCNDISNSFVALILSLTQRNQALLLKYLYAIMYLYNTSRKVNKLKDEIKFYPVRQMWSIPKQNCNDKRYIYFETIYWSNFWNKVQKCIIKLFEEVPCHQYGDVSAGIVVLWPDTYIYTVANILKFAGKNDGITTEALLILKQTYFYIRMCSVQILWDKKFSISLPFTHSYSCAPVPTMMNEVRTNSGNLFCSSMEPLISLLSDNMKCISFTLFVKAMHQLQCVLDSFILWVNVKTRLFISSWNLFPYFIICCSDCKYVSKLLESIFLSLSNLSSSNKVQNLSQMKLEIFELQFLDRQKHILKGFSTDVPDLIHKMVHSLAKTFINYSLKSDMFNKRHLTSFDSLYEILNPLSESVKHIPNMISILLSSISAVSLSFIEILEIKKSISRKRIYVLNDEVSWLLQWVENLAVSMSDKEVLRKQKNIQKLYYITKELVSSVASHQSCLKLNNRILPVADSTENAEENILSNQEKVKWRMMGSRNIFTNLLLAHF